LRHGDLSNKSAYTIAVNYEHMLLTGEEHKLLGIVSKKYRLDWSMAHRLRGLWEQGINIVVITFNSKKRDKIIDFLDNNGVTFSDVVVMKSVRDLRHWLEQNDCTYLDTDPAIIQQLYPWGQLWKGAFI
jgi:hypothetical protein